MLPVPHRGPRAGSHVGLVVMSLPWPMQVVAQPRMNSSRMPVLKSCWCLLPANVSIDCWPPHAAGSTLYHITRYEPVWGHPLLHHGVAYVCIEGDEAKVDALPHLGPYNRDQHGMLCEKSFMVSFQCRSCYCLAAACTP